MTALTWFALLTFLITAGGALEIAIGSRQIAFLRDIAPLPPGQLPAVTIVVAARNEAAGIRQSLESLLLQRGLDFNIILVNDRSDDGTGDIARAVATTDSRLHVVDVDMLPDGWLGKNHAVQQGASRAATEWILFTDGDVIMEPLAIARALSYATREGLDMLAVAPELRMPTMPGNLFGGTFVLLFYQYARPWLARRRGGRHIGVGAFNLVRTEAYRAVGGHERIRLRPDDDMALGKIVKQAGFAQDALHGTGQVVVTWYDSLGDAVVGLEKNSFTGLKYSVVAVVATCLALLAFGVTPWLAIFLTGGLDRLLFLGSVLAATALYIDSTGSSGADPRFAPAFPFALLVFCYIIGRAAWLATSRGEVRWRGRAYPLEELRRNRI